MSQLITSTGRKSKQLYWDHPKCWPIWPVTRRPAMIGMLHLGYEITNCNLSSITALTVWCPVCSLHSRCSAKRRNEEWKSLLTWTIAGFSYLPIINRLHSLPLFAQAAATAQCRLNRAELCRHCNYMYLDLEYTAGLIASGRRRRYHDMHVS